MNVFIKNFGCTSNFAESQSLAQELNTKGFRCYSQGWGEDSAPFRNEEELLFVSECQAIIVNTCTISGDSEILLQKKFAEDIRKIGLSIPIIYMGCSVKNDRSSLQGAVMPKNVLFCTRRGIIPFLKVIKLKGTTSLEIPLPIQSHPENSWVLIKRACTKFCSYCSCGYALFRESECVPTQEIMRQLKHLWASGCKTAILSGPCIGDWRDPAQPSFRFSHLIKKILSETELNIGYLELHPKDITEDLIELLRSPRISKDELGIPIESASDAILNRMRRGYDKRYLDTLFHQIYAAIPSARISTDWIIGFPQENKSDVVETLDFLEKFPFSRIDVYPYSKRSGTPAADMPQISATKFKTHWELAKGYPSLRKTLHFLFDWKQIMGNRSNGQSF